MRKQLLSATATSIAALALLGACSSTNTASTATTAAPATTAPTTTARPAGTTAAGSTSGSASSAEVVAFCAKLQAAGDGNPGLDEIFQTAPEPTMAQWAAFLPTPIARGRAFLDAVKAVPAPASMQPPMAKVIAAYEDELTVLEQIRVAAAGGDTAGFTKLESKNQDEVVPALQAAFAPIGQACGFPG